MAETFLKRAPPLAGGSLLNLYIRLTAEGQTEIRRFKRCRFGEHRLRGIAISEPWNTWYRSLSSRRKRGGGENGLAQFARWRRCLGTGRTVSDLRLIHLSLKL
jgi:hypothetical protein